jgi:hypothetical protein
MSALKGHGFTACGKMLKQAAFVSGHEFTACGKMPNEPFLYQGTTLVVP